MNDNIDAITQAFLDHQAMEETRSYLGRGRRFERLSVEDFNKGWVAAFTSVCADGDQSRATDLDDSAPSLACENSRSPTTLSIPTP